MGYCAEIIEENFAVKAKDFDKAYDAVCKLNAEDDIKEGYYCSPCPSLKHQRQHPANSKSVSGNPNKHFSFMPWNYDEIYDDLFEVFGALGFDLPVNSDGDIDSIYFCDKLGQEHWFLEAIAPYVESGSYIVWRGEDGEMWVNEFLEGEMTEKEVRFTW